VYSPPAGSNGAKLLGEILVGETPSNIAFGDPDLETLFVTARTSVYRVRLGVKGALQY
jgi:gluconolactonase